MKQIFTLLVLFISVTTFSQTTTDSVFNSSPSTSLVVQQIDSTQMARIDNIEKGLNAFYSSNRKSQTFIYLGTGVTVLGALISGNSNSAAGVILPFAGCAMSIIGTVIYLDSYKHLNLKKKRKKARIDNYYY